MRRTPNLDLPAADWYQPAARDMVRNGVTLFQWANEHDKGLLKSECESILKTPEWQAVLRAERNRFYKELANDPTRSRNVAVGQLLFAIQRLLEVEQYDKAVSALTQLFKVEGWSKDETAINIFNELNAKDFDSIRARLKTKELPAQVN